jgi:hypothetical protein
MSSRDIDPEGTAAARTMFPNTQRDLLLNGGLRRQCTARAKHSGERCRRQPILGGFVCDLHGGKTPNAIRVARERLANLVEPAINVLLRILNAPPGTCPTCGRSEDMSVVERAARTVLDRAGLNPTVKVEVERVDSALNDMDDEELASHAEQLAASIRAGEFSSEHTAPDNTFDGVETDEPVTVDGGDR